MKTSEKRLALIQIATIIILLLDIFVTNKLEEYMMAIFLAVILGITILALGRGKKRNLYEKDIILNILIYCFAYYIIIYLSGLVIGFLKTRYSLSFLGILRNTAPILLNIAVAELLRFEMLSKASKNKILIVLTCILFVTIDTKLISYAYDLNTSLGLIKLGYMSVLPILSKNFLLTYLGYKFSYVPNMIYRVIMEIPAYIIPIVPNINEYFKTLLELLFPAYILWKTYKEFGNKKSKSDVRKSFLAQRLTTVILVIFLTVVIALTSGVFKYYALAIGSDSMNPKIKKGDVVIVEKISQENIGTLKVGEILVYKYNDMVVVHRIVKMEKIDDNYYFRTKGDNNTTEDAWTINQSSVIGKTVAMIPYAGIPTVWLSEEV